MFLSQSATYYPTNTGQTDEINIILYDAQRKNVRCYITRQLRHIVSGDEKWRFYYMVVIYDRRRFIVFTFLFFFLQRNGHVTRLRTSYIATGSQLGYRTKVFRMQKPRLQTWIANANEIDVIQAGSHVVTPERCLILIPSCRSNHFYFFYGLF